ncbi:MAG: hypothetical protein M1370_04385, partial [Bacteroidetes bacterium]|nr:hypothetical protein [Bacteroidota bacterium]
MRYLTLLSLLIVTVVMTAGCGSLPGQERTSQPTTTSAAPTTSRATATPKAEPTTTPAPAQTKQPAIGTPAITIPSPSGAGASDEEAAVQTLLDYFDAINQQDYGSAYGYWAGKGAASGQ